jgi:hypothetical protein
VDNRQLTPRGAVLVGSACLVCGIFPILFGLGVAAGLMFVLAGLAVILDYGVGPGVGPDGDLKPGTPLSIRGANLLLGLGIVGLMTAVVGWVAFGPGPRTFSSTITLPFYGSHNRGAGEMTGRFLFGIGAVLLGVMFVTCGIAGVRRFIRAWRP